MRSAYFNMKIHISCHYCRNPQKLLFNALINHGCITMLCLKLLWKQLSQVVQNNRNLHGDIDRLNLTRLKLPMFKY